MVFITFNMVFGTPGKSYNGCGGYIPSNPIDAISWCRGPVAMPSGARNIISQIGYILSRLSMEVHGISNARATPS